MTPYMGVTNDLGEYRLWGLSKGEYILAARPSPEPGPLGRLRFAHVPTLYPNGSTFSEATRLELDWGDVREGVDIRLAPASPTRQSVRVLSDANGCNRCSLRIYRRDPEADLLVTSSGRPSAKGDLLIEGLPPGEYLLGGFSRLPNRSMITGLRDFLIAPDADSPFQLQLREPVSVRGRVIFEDPPDEIPEPEGQDSLFPQFNIARTAPLARDREKVFFSCRGEAAPFAGDGPERSFEVHTSPGLCQLDIRGPGGSYVAGISLDAHPLEKPQLLIPTTGLSSELVVRIRFDSGKITGRLEQPNPNAAVYFVPAGGPSFLRYQLARPDPDGSFRKSLPPGRWHVVAFIYAQPEVFKNLRKLASRLPGLEVKAGQVTALSSPLSPIQ